ncbi:MAG: hypothetical protein ACRYF4_14765 [Janthinobacterium lividum]
MFWKKKVAKHTFNDVLSSLGAQKFDVAAAGEGAGGARVAGAYRVSKYGCAAEIAPSPAVSEKIIPQPAPAEIVTKVGFVLNGQIARLVDKGYQKFLKTPKLEIVATADHLRALHQFSEELDEAAGTTMLYNESLGTTSDSYMYDRVKGRETHLGQAHRTADPLQRSATVTGSGTDGANDL